MTFTSVNLLPFFFNQHTPLIDDMIKKHRFNQRGWKNKHSKCSLNLGERRKPRREPWSEEKWERACWVFKSIHAALSWAWWVQRSLNSGRDWTRRQLQAMNTAASAQATPQSPQNMLRFDDDAVKLLMRCSIVLCDNIKYSINCFCSIFFQVASTCLLDSSPSVKCIDQLSCLTISRSPASLLGWLTAPVLLSQSDINTLPSLTSHWCRALNAHQPQEDNKSSTKETATNLYLTGPKKRSFRDIMMIWDDNVYYYCLFQGRNTMKQTYKERLCKKDCCVYECVALKFCVCMAFVF